MAARLHIDPAAEREANEIAFHFMDSTDVVGDMSRAYGQDLSSVRIHTGEDAARRVAPTGADAFSTGKDVFFARGAFDPNNPASRGLLAHELAHSLQQGGEAGNTVEQSAPEGAAQGGLLDWFRSKFGRKKQPAEPEEPEMEISEPQLMTGPINIKKSHGADDATRTFRNGRSLALNEMLEGASKEQLQNPLLRQLVLDDYNTNMNARLKSLDYREKRDMDGDAFRGGAGELSSLNIMISSMLPESFSSEVLNAQKEGGTDGALDYIRQTVGGNEDLMQFLEGTNASFDGVRHYEDPAARSALMINNLFLRNINGAISKRIGEEQKAAAAAARASGITGTAAIAREVDKTVSSRDLLTAAKLQKELNSGTGEKAVTLRNLLTNRFRRG